jgi:hypothetical protein
LTYETHERADESFADIVAEESEQSGLSSMNGMIKGAKEFLKVVDVGSKSNKVAKLENL